MYIVYTRELHVALGLLVTVNEYAYDVSLRYSHRCVRRATIVVQEALLVAVDFFFASIRAYGLT